MLPIFIQKAFEAGLEEKRKTDNKKKSRRNQQALANQLVATNLAGMNAPQNGQQMEIPSNAQ